MKIFKNFMKIHMNNYMKVLSLIKYNRKQQNNNNNSNNRNNNNNRNNIKINYYNNNNNNSNNNKYRTYSQIIETNKYQSHNKIIIYIHLILRLRL